LNEAYLDKELLDMPVFWDSCDPDGERIEIDTIGLGGRGLLLMPGGEDLDEDDFPEDDTEA
jgi:hypothetical protein